MHNKIALPGYRKDIDGLRALAVILVILFHAGIRQVSSGFIGVDIFFTISGFLITGIIISQKENASFNLSNFFIHRLWRIQPAYIVMSLATLLIASYFYLPDDFLAYLHSGKYSALFLSNQFFARQSTAYASPAADMFLLLHTWSLAIEWQWYLFLPLGILLVGFTFRLPPLQRYIKNQTNALAAVWFVLTPLAAVLALLLASYKADDAYYSLLTRIFEFMTGGAAFFLTRYVHSVPAIISHTVGLLSLSTLLFVSAHPGVINFYPNLYALLVVAASSLIMFTGTYKNSVTSRFLALAPVAFTGSISYSLYLWHWPVFATARYLGYSLNGKVLTLCLALTVLMSLLSYYLVEQPCRRCRRSLKFSIPVLVVVPIIIFNAAYSFAIHRDGIPGRFGSEYNHVAITINSSLAKAGHRPDCLEGAQNPGSCIFGDVNGNKSALLIGDSNSNHFWGFFDVLAHDAHIKMTALSSASCLTLPELYQFDWWIYRNQSYEECHANTARYYELIKNKLYDYVIIGEIWEQYANGPYLINKAGDERSDALSKERMNKAVREALNIIIASGARPVFIRTIAPMPRNYQQCIRRHVISRTPYSESECDQQNPQSSENPWIISMFAQLQKEYPSLLILDPKQIQCESGQCITAINQIPLYRDVGHLTDFASYEFGNRYLNAFGNPLR